MSTVTLDEVIDSAMQLPPEQREMLVSILYMDKLKSGDAKSPRMLKNR